MMIRQGDVFLVRVAKLPSRLRSVRRDNGKLVLAYGEATGHTHVIEAPPNEATLLTNREGERFLKLMKESFLVHQEHAPIKVEPGLYRQLPQQEWSDEMERPRDMID